MDLMKRITSATRGVAIRFHANLNPDFNVTNTVPEDVYFHEVIQ
jgi:hypothetical protein